MENSSVQTLAHRLLQTFSQFDREELDLHVFFETAGNDPDQRRSVLEAVDELVDEGFVEAVGGDFYRLTGKGRKAIVRN